MDYNQYARQSLGPLDLSSLNTEREVAQTTQKTNWESLQNQFKNLKDQLEQKRVQSERQFARGLEGVAESSFDRMRTAEDASGRRGILSSGMADLNRRADTTIKGEEVQKLLDKAGDQVAGTLAQEMNAITKLASEEGKLNQGLGKTLGEIGQRDLGEQMQYGRAVAGIAGTKEARDMANALAAAQRAAQERMAAASRGGGSGKKSKDEQEADEFARRTAIRTTLMDPNTSARDKKIIMGTYLGVNNPDEVYENYKKNATLTKTNEKAQKEFEKTLKEYQKGSSKAEEDLDRMIRAGLRENQMGYNQQYDKDFQGPSYGLANARSMELEDDVVRQVKDALMGKGGPFKSTQGKNVDYLGPNADLVNSLTENLGKAEFYSKVPVSNTANYYDQNAPLTRLQEGLNENSMAELMDYFDKYNKAYSKTNQYKSTGPTVNQLSELAKILYGIQ